ncbi:MAG: hypothetical protein ACPGOY_08005 [Rhodospirillaceae bacterium]
MKRRHIRAHGLIWRVLACALPLLLIAALVARPGERQQTTAEQIAPPASGQAATSGAEQ